MAYYIASLIILQDHATALLVWLVALMLVGGILSDRAGTAAGFGVWLAVALPLFMWTARHLSPALGDARPRHDRRRLPDRAGRPVARLRRPTSATPADLGVADIAWLHLNGLLMFAAAYFLINVTHAAVTGAVAAAFALWQGVLAAIVLNVGAIRRSTSRRSGSR